MVLQWVSKLYCITDVLRKFTGTGKDYSSGPYKVTFPAGVTQIEVNVPITNDDQVEEKAESFSLSINSSSLPMDITVGNPDQATVTIVDDDGK